MDFRFNINTLLPKKINKITHTLIPEGFKGDRREYNECQRLLTRIIDDMGEASAKAQGLNRTITSALKLRDTDHVLYLMVDNDGNKGLGSVVGLLKTGSKSLFMFDENGFHYQLKPRCILDFYIHESRQRMGLGNELYQYMLTEENLKPIKLAIDRPSEKFLAFLMKHYGLTSIIQQNNKFVVFKGFFDDESHKISGNERITSSTLSRQSMENKLQPNISEDVPTKKYSVNGTPVSHCPYGRYAASRPPCSMANIIHNTAPVGQPIEYTKKYVSVRSAKKEVHDRPRTLDIFIEPQIENNIEDNKINKKHSIDEDVAIPESECLQNFPEEIGSSQSEELSKLPDETFINNGTSDILGSETSSQHSLDETCADNLIKSASLLCLQEDSDGDEKLNVGHLDLKFYHSPLW